MFAVSDVEWTKQAADTNQLQTAEECLEEVKRKRIEIAGFLLQAGAIGGGRFIPGCTPECWKMLPAIVNSSNALSSALLKDLMHAFAGINMDSGGLEVMELLADVRASPRSLKSSCRILIRNHLSRPILLEGDVDKLPLSRHMKRYVAMEIV